jgi:hypothetical protein
MTTRDTVGTFVVTYIWIEKLYKLLISRNIMFKAKIMLTRTFKFLLSYKNWRFIIRELSFYSS